MSIARSVLRNCLGLGVVLGLAGCAMALPSPQVSRSVSSRETLASLVSQAREKDLAPGKDGLVHRFFENGPGTVAVAERLRLGVMSSPVHAEHYVGTLGEGMMTGASALAPGPAGIGLFLLGAADQQKSYPKWVDRYQWMLRDMRRGEVLQVVSVYSLGEDPAAASKMAAVRLGDEALRYLGELTSKEGTKVPVSGTAYSGIGNFEGNKIPVHYFVGTSTYNKKGNLSLVWWEENHLTGLGTVLMMEGSINDTSFVPIKGMTSPKGQTLPFELTRLECMPVPGSVDRGLCVATLTSKHYGFFVGSISYKKAMRDFSQDYLVAGDSSLFGGDEVSVWHAGKGKDISIPSLVHSKSG